jgi:hypothetical protein
MNFPVIFDNILPKKLFVAITDDLESNWTFGQQAIESKTSPKFWSKKEDNTLLYFECACYVKLKIQKILKKDLKLIRINVNGQTSFQSSEFHTDFDEDDFWTIVVFTTPHWNTNWGGELIIRDEITNLFKYAPYYPNRGVLFPSDWAHRAEAPNALTNAMRTSIAFSYCPPNLIDNFYEGHPLKKYL